MKENSSILVLTHHKAASTLLRRMITTCYSPRYRVIDYAGQYWKEKWENRSWNNVYEKLNACPQDYFAEEKHIYGPLREYVNVDTRQFKKIIIARDPAATLLSEYVSFGFTHPVPKEGSPREKFLKKREEIKVMGPDEYATRHADKLFERHEYLYSVSDSSLVLPYSRLVSDTSGSLRDYSRYVGCILPSIFVRGIIATREKLSNVDKHKSRQRDFRHFSLSDTIREDVKRKFSKFESLY